MSIRVCFKCKEVSSVTKETDLCKYNNCNYPLYPFRLHVAIANTNSSKIIQLLKEGYDVNEFSDTMGTPLNLAIRYRLPIIHLLLVYGANSDAVHILKSGKSWHVLDDFYSSMRYNRLALETLNMLFKYGANPYLAEEKTQSYFKPYFWKFIKQRAFDIVASLHHLSALELIAILEQICPGAENIQYCKKWNLVVTKHITSLGKNNASS